MPESGREARARVPGVPGRVKGEVRGQGLRIKAGGCKITLQPGHANQNALKILGNQSCQEKSHFFQLISWSGYKSGQGGHPGRYAFRKYIFFMPEIN